MSKFQIIYGACVTAILDLILYITALGEEIIKSGLITALFIIFAFSVIVKIMISRTTNEGKNTDWESVVSFAFGSGIVTIVTLVLSLLAIV